MFGNTKQISYRPDTPPLIQPQHQSIEGLTMALITTKWNDETLYPDDFDESECPFIIMWHLMRINSLWWRAVEAVLSEPWHLLLVTLWSSL